MTNILGVCNSTDSGAGLIVDGNILAAANEERFVRKKLTATFPYNSIEYVLDEADCSIKDIDWVGCGAWKGIDPVETLPRLAEDIFAQQNSGEETKKIILNRLSVSAANDERNREHLFVGMEKLGIGHQKVIFCDHHYSHALTAFYCSQFDDAIVFCADGRGDFRSITLWSATRSEGLKLVDSASELNSPGALYGSITKLLGFIPDRHEGKVTGLAANGKSGKAHELIRSVYRFDREDRRLNGQIGPYYKPFVSADLPALAKALADEKPADIAFAVQAVLEESLSAFLLNHIGEMPNSFVNLCLAGGCMGNVKLNWELSKLKPVANTFVFPAMGDGGGALGGAINAALIKGSARHFRLSDVYLGPSFDDIHIEAAAKNVGLAFEQLEGSEKVARAARLLADGKILGWFQGRMEYGPRALGARSILASGKNPMINTTLNRRLNRTEFMPFAPVTTEALAAQCLEGWNPDQLSAQFMTICYRATSLLKMACPAVVHVDGTVRPQVIPRNRNSDYHDVISAHHQITGEPALINTSFNHHEEPIVNTPEDAFRSFKRGNMDVLIAGNLMFVAQ